MTSGFKWVCGEAYAGDACDRVERVNSSAWASGVRPPVGKASSTGFASSTLRVGGSASSACPPRIAAAIGVVQQTEYATFHCLHATARGHRPGGIHDQQDQMRLPARYDLVMQVFARNT